MKENSGLTKFITLILIISFVSLNTISAQVTNVVAVSNFKFEPANLTIDVGDTVRWTNNEGTHSVDGSTATYPNNPESFKNDGGGAGWVFSFKFTKEGIYDYQCGVHGISMTGKINVGNVTGITKVTSLKGANYVYPNPTKGLLNFVFPESKMVDKGHLQLSIYNVKGEKFDYQVVRKDNLINYSVNKLSEGIYFYKLSDDNELINSGKFIKTN